MILFWVIDHETNVLQFLGIFEDMRRKENNVLEQIIVQKDFPDANDRISCDTPTKQSELRQHFDNRGNSNPPDLVLCDYAFKTQSISALKASKDICDRYFQHPANINVQSLGEILIHEYTHCRVLVEKYLGGESPWVKDHIYTCQGAQSMKVYDSTLLRWNADNYSCFAVEFYWSMQCGKKLVRALPLMPREKYAQARRESPDP